MAPRTRSTPIAERESNPPRPEGDHRPTVARTEDDSLAPPGETSTEGANPPAPSDAVLEAIQSNIARLKRYKELQDEVARLQAEISYGDLADTLPTRRRRRDDDSDDDREIKLKNIPTFALEFTLQQRQEWLLDLAQQFDGAPRKYYNNKKKILGALSYMDPICRQRWYRHIEEKGATHLLDMKEDWPYFKNWTLTLIKNAASLEAEVRSQLERTHQKKDENPKEFHSRLDAFEQHFTRQPEKERALTYFAKLRYDLQELINLHIIKLPETRDEMINIAHHFWEIQAAANNRKRKPAEDQSTFSRRPRKQSKPFKDHKDSQSKHKDFSSKDDLNPVGRDGERNRCFNCGSKRHYSNKCPHPLKDKDRNASTTIQSAQGKDRETK